MRSRVVRIIDRLEESFWFVPTLMVLGAMVLAALATALDERGGAALAGLSMVYSGSAEGARSLLSTIASSMLTVASITFSLTITALTTASSQFGPRLLRSFIRDRGNQVVLGTFIAAFIYCLLVLRTIRGGEDNTFVPHLAVTLGVVLALAGLAVLIYFIHHVAQSLQVPFVVNTVGNDLDEAIERVFPQEIGDAATRAERRDIKHQNAPDDAQTRAVRSSSMGYIQAVDPDDILRVAVDADVMLTLVSRPGDYIIPGDVLARVWPAERVTDDLHAAIERSFVLGKQRTPQQDVAFAAFQLVEIAVRALSSGINDPFTAVTCVDRLSASLCRLADRSLPSPYRADEQGVVRVIANPIALPELIDVCFDLLRHDGADTVVVALSLLDALARIGRHADDDETREALLRHATLIEEANHDAGHVEADRKRIQERYQQLVAALA